MITIDNYLDVHYIHRSNWLRAAVLGANDGIISVASLAIGVATANATREPVLLATIAGLVAGAISMAAGEYVSVNSQADIEKSDIERERRELEEMPENELKILGEIFEKRGLKKETAMQVAKELTEVYFSPNNAIAPSAFASAIAFIAGGILPFLVTLLSPLKYLESSLYATTLVSLLVLGALSAKSGGSSILKSAVRILVWGIIAMGLSTLVGYLFSTNV